MQHVAYSSVSEVGCGLGRCVMTVAVKCCRQQVVAEKIKN